MLEQKDEPVVTLGIFAHANAGKTTITERLLYETKAIDEVGSVDDGTTVTDDLNVERARGISVRSALVNFNLPSLKKVQLIDTPGHIDFSAEVERAITVLDAAVLVISGVEGIEAQTYSVWKALRQKNVPVIIFINKMDRMGANYERVIEQLKTELDDAIVPIVNVQVVNGKITISDVPPLMLLDMLSKYDDECIDMYFKCVENNLTPNKDWLDHKIKYLLGKNVIYPVIGGSALKDVGIDNFVTCLDKLLPTFKRKIDADFSAFVYSVRIEESENLYTKILTGEISKRQAIQISSEESQKIKDIKDPSKKSHTSVDYARSGDIVILNGLTVPVGTMLGNFELKRVNFVKPLLTMCLKSDKMLEAVDALRILQKEDPYLTMHYNKLTGDVTVSLMGEVQAQVLEQILYDRFKLTASFVSPRIICKEAPTKEGIGKCSYTRVSGLTLKVKPLLEGSGVVFESEIPTGTLLRKYQRQVERLVMQYSEQGLKGWELTNAKVVLTDGYFDSMGSETIDFNISTPIALFRALRDARTRILEPVCRYNLKIDAKDTGAISQRLEARQSHFQIREGLDASVNLYGSAKLRNLISFQNEVRKLTSGRGEFTYELDSYQECSDQEEEIPFIGPDPRNENHFVVNEMGGSMINLDAQPTKKKNMSSKFAWQQLKKSLGR